MSMYTIVQGLETFSPVNYIVNIWKSFVIETQLLLPPTEMITNRAYLQKFFVLSYTNTFTRCWRHFI